MSVQYSTDYRKSGESSLLLTDFAGRSSFNTLFGESVTGIRQDNVSLQFQYNISTRDVKITKSGSGAESHANESATVGITTTVGSCQIESIDTVRYRPGHEITAQFTSTYAGAQAGVNQYHGLLNSADGVAFGFKDGVFGIWYVEGGVETHTPQTAWLGEKLLDNVSGEEFILDPTKMNIYMIQYGWLGVAPIVLSVYTGFKGGWKVVHWIDLTNTQTTPHLNNPTLPISVKISRSTGTGTAASISTSSWRAGATGGETESNSSNRWNAWTQLDHTWIDGQRNHVFSIQNKSTYAAKPNHIILELGITAFVNTTNKTVAFYGTKGATLAGNSAFTDLNANSVVAISSGGTMTGGTRGPATILFSNSQNRIDVRNTGIIIYPGETFSFDLEAGAGTNGTVSISARWVEYF